MRHNKAYSGSGAGPGAEETSLAERGNKRVFSGRGAARSTEPPRMPLGEGSPGLVGGSCSASVPCRDGSPSRRTREGASRLSEGLAEPPEDPATWLPRRVEARPRAGSRGRSGTARTRRRGPGAPARPRGRRPGRAAAAGGAAGPATATSRFVSHGLFQEKAL